MEGEISNDTCWWRAWTRKSHRTCEQRDLQVACQIGIKLDAWKNNEGRKIGIWHKPFEIDASDGHSGGG